MRDSWLVGLVDLNTEKDYVQQRIADYFTDLLGIGFSGFRIDAAKHVRKLASPIGVCILSTASQRRPTKCFWLLRPLFPPRSSPSPALVFHEMSRGTGTAFSHTGEWLTLYASFPPCCAAAYTGGPCGPDCYLRQV